jgi:hypothetical protein
LLAVTIIAAFSAVMLKVFVAEVTTMPQYRDASDTASHGVWTPPGKIKGA